MRENIDDPNMDNAMVSSTIAPFSLQGLLVNETLGNLSDVFFFLALDDNIVKM